MEKIRGLPVRDCIGSALAASFISRQGSCVTYLYSPVDKDDVSQQMN